MSSAFTILLAVLIITVLVVIAFMMILNKGTFAKVEDVHGRLAKEREQHGLPTASLKSHAANNESEDHYTESPNVEAADIPPRQEPSKVGKAKEGS